MMNRASRRRFVEGVQNAHALEGDVVLMPDPFALTTADENLREMFRAHREESQSQQDKLRERPEAMKSLGLASLHKTSWR